MLSTDSDISVAVSDSSEYVFGAHYMPCEGEPLAPEGDDLMDDISKETTKEADLDGLTPAILEARYDRKNKVVSWYIRAVRYRWLARWLFGYMGPENTRPLSSCIYEDIRTRYNTGGQSGYADAENRS
ncbi:Hypothetical predicted protein [Paramuricea clavata]|uniref:Uncharacterized protein n=1 Tax=Paramuricea clavata TaxID=317549 RepID=A0A6S7FF93_PARCT|nr:Hypothetical predicted protein [Paramuricea clavata]